MVLHFTILYNYIYLVATEKEVHVGNQQGAICLPVFDIREFL